MGISPFFIPDRKYMNNKEQELETLLSPTVESLGCQIWGIEYKPQGRYTTLRIFIEHAEGISVEQCSEVSQEVSALLDVENQIKSAYTLEVSSPGMDRLLFKGEHYTSNVGQTIDVRLNFPFEGRRNFVGQIVGFKDDEVVMQIDDMEFCFPVENVQRARVMPQYD
jgi:ribosome maturation factor RimP